MSGDAFGTLQKSVAGAAIPPGGPLVVAVSGGPDSVGLLRAAHAALPARTLVVAHVHHGIRGDEATADAAFVAALAEALGLAYEERRVDTPSWARQHRMSPEAAARHLRMRELESVRAQYTAGAILLAHTMDDAAETVLLNLLRGTGLDGLAGMRPVSGHLIRPLLNVRKETILLALQEMHQGYRLDSTNLDLRLARNHLRRETMPHLDTVQREAVPLLARTASLLAADSDLVRLEAQRALDTMLLDRGVATLSLAAGGLRALHPALRAHVLRRAVQLLLGDLRDLSASHIADLESGIIHGGTHKVYRLPHGIEVDLGHTSVRFRLGASPSRTPLETVRWTVPATCDTASGRLLATVFDVTPGELHRLSAVRGPNHAILDAGRTGTDLVAGPRVPGERMRPLGLEGTRKVQDLMVDRKIPRELRDSIPVIRREDEIVWIPGVATGAGYAAAPGVTRILHLVFTPAPARIP